MEVLLLILIVGVGAVWWLNSEVYKKGKTAAATTEAAPYKVEAPEPKAPEVETIAETKAPTPKAKTASTKVKARVKKTNTVPAEKPAAKPSAKPAAKKPRAKTK